MEFQIREAKESDIPEIAKVFRSSKQSALPYLPDIHTPEEDLCYFRDTLFLSNQIFIVYTVETLKIVAFIAFDKDWVNHLYLLSEVHRLGFGKQLLEIAQGRSLCLKVWAFQKNVTAVKFYQQQGFVPIKQTDGSENEEKEPDILLEWRDNKSKTT